jgi:TonB family protein
MAHRLMSVRLMPSLRLALPFLITACVTSGSLGGEHVTTPRARVTLVPFEPDATLRVLPQALEPMLPSADRLAPVIAHRLGERATVDVRYCVGASGRLVSAALARGSTLPAFDHAVMTDIVDWRFTPQPGPDHLRSCQVATIVYRPRA